MSVIRVEPVQSSVEKLEIVQLLYDGDKPFVPITPLKTLDSATTFYKATIDDRGPIRAASSFDEWLNGCDKATKTPHTVYELATSNVRTPMGGFADPSLQQLLTFTRLVAILEPYVSRERSDPHKICVMASIAANNKRSLEGMEALGLQRIPPNNQPQWLIYEHRAWFPKLAEERPTNEAVYLWLPGDRVKALLQRMAPVVTGSQPLVREKEGAKGTTESFRVELLTPEYESFVDRHGTLQAAIDKVPYDIFAPPPDLALLTPDRDGQPMEEIAF